MPASNSTGYAAPGGSSEASKPSTPVPNPVTPMASSASSKPSGTRSSTAKSSGAGVPRVTGGYQNMVGGAVAAAIMYAF